VNTGTGWVRIPGYRLRFILRVGLLASALAYLAFIVASHSQPFDSGLEGPLQFGGWLRSAALFGVFSISMGSVATVYAESAAATLRQAGRSRGVGRIEGLSVPAT